MKIYSYFLAGCILLGISTQAVALGEPAQIHFVVKQFVVTGLNPLSANETDAILNKYVGEHDGLEGLQAAADEFESTLRSSGFAFYRVSLIPQALEKGIITFDVSEFKIDRIEVIGNEHYSEQNILNSAPTLNVGEAPNTNVLSRAINMANTKPKKNITLRFAESEEGGAISAKLIVKDESPDFAFASLNNTGNSATGLLRLTGGYQFTNLRDEDHNLSLSYTIAPDDFSAVSQFGLVYSIPQYENGSRFDFILSNSNVDSGQVGGVAVSGKGLVVSLRYNKIFLQTGAYKDNIDIGFDYKKFDDEQNFGGLIQTNTILSRPILIAYKGSKLTATGSLDFSIGLSSNLAGGNNNEDADYAASRSGVTQTASSSWSKINYTINYLHFLENNWLLRFGLVGQETSDLLIPGEQFGVGGSGSIRGFNQREILGDKGFQLNFEVWMPSFSEFDIRPIAFVDIGQVITIDPLADINGNFIKTQSPASIGFGLKWSWMHKLNLVVDVGNIIKAAGTAVKGDTRIHFDLSYSF